MRLHLALLLFPLTCLVGCHKAIKRPSGYWGETQPMVQVVQAVTQNNQAVPTLWASLGYKTTVVDAKKKTHTVTGDGVLLYRTPRDMRLIGNVVAVGTIFEVGSIAERYWLVLKPEMETMWWGYHRNVGKPCVTEPVPIPPYYVVEVLGVAAIFAHGTPVALLTNGTVRDARGFTSMT